MSLFAVAVNFEVKPDHIEEFTARVCLHAQNCLEKEEGCAQFDVCVHPEDPTKIFLYEAYTSPYEFYEVHTKTEHFADFQNTIKDWIVNKQLHHFNVIFPE